MTGRAHIVPRNTNVEITATTPVTQASAAPACQGTGCGKGRWVPLGLCYWGRLQAKRTGYYRFTGLRKERWIHVNRLRGGYKLARRGYYKVIGLKNGTRDFFVFPLVFSPTYERVTSISLSANAFPLPAAVSPTYVLHFHFSVGHCFSTCCSLSYIHASTSISLSVTFFSTCCRLSYVCVTAAISQ